MDNRQRGLTGATLALTQTVALWTVLMPPLHDVRHYTPGAAPEFADDVRQAELVIGVTSIAVGFIASRIENSWTPLVASSLLVFTLVGAYEYTLRKQPSETPPRL